MKLEGWKAKAVLISAILNISLTVLTFIAYAAIIILMHK